MDLESPNHCFREEWPPNNICIRPPKNIKTALLVYNRKMRGPDSVRNMQNVFESGRCPVQTEQSTLSSAHTDTVAESMSHSVIFAHSNIGHKPHNRGAFIVIRYCKLTLSLVAPKVSPCNHLNAPLLTHNKYRIQIFLSNFKFEPIGQHVNQ